MADIALVGPEISDAKSPSSSTATISDTRSETLTIAAPSAPVAVPAIKNDLSSPQGNTEGFKTDDGEGVKSFGPVETPSAESSISKGSIGGIEQSETAAHSNQVAPSTGNSNTDNIINNSTDEKEGGVELDIEVPMDIDDVSPTVPEEGQLSPDSVTHTSPIPKKVLTNLQALKEDVDRQRQEERSQHRRLSQQQSEQPQQFEVNGSEGIHQNNESTSAAKRPLEVEGRQGDIKRDPAQALPDDISMDFGSGGPNNDRGWDGGVGSLKRLSDRMDSDSGAPLLPPSSGNGDGYQDRISKRARQVSPDGGNDTAQGRRSSSSRAERPGRERDRRERERETEKDTSLKPFKNRDGRDTKYVKGQEKEELERESTRRVASSDRFSHPASSTGGAPSNATLLDRIDPENGGYAARERNRDRERARSREERDRERDRHRRESDLKYERDKALGRHVTAVEDSSAPSAAASAASTAYNGWRESRDLKAGTNSPPKDLDRDAAIVGGVRRGYDQYAPDYSAERRYGSGGPPPVPAARGEDLRSRFEDDRRPRPAPAAGRRGSMESASSRYTDRPDHRGDAGRLPPSRSDSFLDGDRDRRGLSSMPPSTGPGAVRNRSPVFQDRGAGAGGARQTETFRPSGQAPSNLEIKTRPVESIPVRNGYDRAPPPPPRSSSDETRVAGGPSGRQPYVASGMRDRVPPPPSLALAPGPAPGRSPPTEMNVYRRDGSLGMANRDRDRERERDARGPSLPPARPPYIASGANGVGYRRPDEAPYSRGYSAGLSPGQGQGYMPAPTLPGPNAMDRPYINGNMNNGPPPPLNRYPPPPSPMQNGLYPPPMPMPMPMPTIPRLTTSSVIDAELAEMKLRMADLERLREAERARDAALAAVNSGATSHFGGGVGGGGGGVGRGGYPPVPGLSPNGPPPPPPSYRGGNGAGGGGGGGGSMNYDQQQRAPEIPGFRTGPPAGYNNNNNNNNNNHMNGHRDDRDNRRFEQQRGPPPPPPSNNNYPPRGAPPPQGYRDDRSRSNDRRY